MNKSLIFILPLLGQLISGFCQQKVPAIQKNETGRIVIEVEFPPKIDAYYKHIEFTPIDFEMLPEWDSVAPVMQGNTCKWVVSSDVPLFVNMDAFMGSGNMSHFYEPGDSIHIDYRTKDAVYTGNNSGKFQVKQLIKKAKKQQVPPENNSITTTKSLHDYEEWSDYLDRQLIIIDSILLAHKTEMTPPAYDHLRGELVTEVEYSRMMKFGALEAFWLYNKMPGAQLGPVFDKIAANKYGKWLRTYDGKIGVAYYFYDFVRRSVERQFNFDLGNDTLKSVRRKILYADLAKKIYKGYTLQDCLVYLLTTSGLKEHTYKDGYVPEIEKLLADFYAMPGYPGYKSYVQDYEEKIRTSVTLVGNKAPNFSLENLEGEIISKNQFHGKVLLLNFLKPDNKESVEMNNALANVLLNFNNDTNLVLISIAQEPIRDILMQRSFGPSFFPVEKEKYLQNIILKADSTVEKAYNISSYPKVFLIDDIGEFVYNGFKSTWDTTRNFPDPRRDNGKKLIVDLKKQLAILKDGPYIIHDKDSVTIYNIENAALVSHKKSVIAGSRELVNTDNIAVKFPVTIKKAYQIEPSSFKRPKKLFVLSDIEGNFSAFRKLLVANNIIDEQYNWKFGNGHLVFAGDMFDRGRQVTECLWLIYSLEEKSRAAGGYVHFILGNHEIMNLNGNVKYVDAKYKQNAGLMELSYKRLYEEDSELGRWIRTKNIMEKIGSLLFVHGGISREINTLDASIDEINAAARRYYAKDSLVKESKDSLVQTVFNSHLSPFWYRGYYSRHKNRLTPGSVVDSTLKKFGVSRIVTGHTIIANEITVHFNGKIINTDTQHAKGRSEALLIEGDVLYRVNQQGNRYRLIDQSSGLNDQASRPEK